MRHSNSLDISEARLEVTRIDERLKKSRIIWVTRRKKKAFALVDAQWLEAILETLEVLEDPDAFRMLEASSEDIRHGRLHSHQRLLELGIIPPHPTRGKIGRDNDPPSANFPS
jgi:PHD/YefM family antitoxin component YafN of YafNO toxin-antitoxin module